LEAFAAGNTIFFNRRKEVMKPLAENLTPVTLELGGKVYTCLTGCDINKLAKDSSWETLIAAPDLCGTGLWSYHEDSTAFY